jgi:hypothetical protein
MAEGPTDGGIAAERYRYHLDKAGDIGRQMAFAGVAACIYVLGLKLRGDAWKFAWVAAQLFVIALVIDFARHFLGMCYYRWGGSRSANPRHLTALGFALVVIQAALMIGGYVSLLVSGFKPR